MWKKIKIFYILNAPLLWFNLFLLMCILISILFKNFILSKFCLSHENILEIITVSSIFAGFSYNSFENIQSYRTTKEFIKLNNDNYLGRYYNSNFVTNVWLTCSVLLGIFCSISNFLNANSVFYLLEIDLLVCGIAVFFFQTIQFKILLKWIKTKRY